MRIPCCNRQEVQITGNVRDNDCSELAVIPTAAFRGYVSHTCAELYGRNSERETRANRYGMHAYNSATKKTVWEGKS